jgi:4-hydroxy-4-methyl-2-oxoglutarate aldolase
MTSAFPPVSAIADVLALWGAEGALSPPLAPIAPAGSVVAGRARTLRIVAADTGPGLAPLYDLLSDDLTGCVLFLAGAQAVGAAVWGEILSTAAATRNAAAVLIDGAARDRPDVVAAGVPVYARDERVVGPAGRAHVEAVDVAVTIDGTEIAPDDGIVVDATGCVRVVGAQWQSVMEGAARYAAAEDEVLRALESGEPLSSAYRLKKVAVDELRRRAARGTEVMAGPS